MGELITAGEGVERISSHRNVAKLIMEIIESPEKVRELKKASHAVTSRELTSDKALASPESST